MFKKLSCLKQALILIAVLFFVCALTAFAGIKCTHRIIVPVGEYGVTDLSSLEIENPEVISLELSGSNMIIKPRTEGTTTISKSEQIIAYVKCSESGFMFESVNTRYTGDVWTRSAVLVFLFGAAMIITVNLRRQIKREFYHYSTPLLTGIAILLWLLFAILVLRLFNSRYFAFENVLYDTPSNLLYITLPVMLLFTMGMFASNLSLLRHEGVRLRNVLGSFIGLIISAGIIAVILNDNVMGSVDDLRLHQFFINFISGIILWTECKLAAIILCGIQAARHKPKTDKDYILILGCRLAKNGNMTPLLRGRVERALSFAKHQQSITGKMPVFIPCGGQGKDEIRSEAEAMREFLINEGVSEENILCEDKSLNTWENIKNAKAMMKPDSKVAYSTTSYHVFRAGVWALRNELEAEGMGSKTKWYYAPNAFMREYVALIMANIKHEVLMTVLIAVQSGLLAYLYQ